MSDEKIDHAALIAEVRRQIKGVMKDDGYGYLAPARDIATVNALLRRLADALEAAQQAPAVNADGLVAEIRAAYVEYAESADFPTTKHYLEWKLAGGAEREFDSMIAEVEARGLEKAAEEIGGGFKGLGDVEWISRAALITRAQQVREGNK